MKPARLAPQARRDALDTAAWIAKDDPGAARAFRDAVVAVAARIGTHPAIGVLRLELIEPPVRFVVMTGFPFVVVYDSGRQPPLILRILHGARDLPELLEGH